MSPARSRLRIHGYRSSAIASPNAIASRRKSARPGLFGHRVKAVATRDGFVEYACHCGHSFLRESGQEQTIRHPLKCFCRAHRIRFVARRRGYAEYVCTDCGHPFYFADSRQIGNPRDVIRNTKTRCA